VDGDWDDGVLGVCAIMLADALVVVLGPDTVHWVCLVRSLFGAWGGVEYICGLVVFEVV